MSASSISLAAETPSAPTAPEKAFAAKPVTLQNRPGVLAFKESTHSKSAGLGARFWDVVRTVGGDSYSVFRGACYIFADYFSPASKKLGNLFENKLEGKFEEPKAFAHFAQGLESGKFSLPASPEYVKKRFLGVETFAPLFSVHQQGVTHEGWIDKQKAELNNYDDLSKPGKFFSLLKSKPRLNNSMDVGVEYNHARHDSYVSAGKLLMSQIEGVFFGLLTTVYLYGEIKNNKLNMSAAVAAELGKDAKDVGLRDIMHSKNPFIVSEKNRLVLQALTSYAADASFFGGIKAGLVGAAVKTTIMRTRMNRDHAPYDGLRSVVGKIQQRGGQMTDSAREAFVDEMTDVVQMVRREQRLPVLQQDALTPLRPVYDHLVRALAGGEMDEQGALYFLGCCLDEHHADQSMYNLHALINHGPAGVVKAKHQQLDLSQPAKNIGKPQAALTPEPEISESRSSAIKRIVQEGSHSLSPAAILERSEMAKAQTQAI